jgi:hypothetical protein
MRSPLGVVARMDNSPSDRHGVEPGGETMLDAGTRALSLCAGG